jgi:energy-coupling factor transport system permease protein
MNSEALIDQFTATPAIAGRFDPRVRLLAFLVVAFAIMLTLDVEIYLLLSGILAVGFITVAAARRRLTALFLPLLVMIAITGLLHLLFSPGSGEVLVELAGVSLTESALQRAVMFSWRLVLFMGLAVLHTSTVSAEEVARVIWRGLTALHLPIAGLGAAIYLAIRFLPELVANFRQIKAAQQARGAGFAGGAFRRIALSIPLLVPVVIGAMRRAEVLSDCLAVRGWGAVSRRSFHGRRSLAVADWLALLALLLLLGTIAILTQ